MTRLGFHVGIANSAFPDLEDCGTRCEVLCFVLVQAWAVTCRSCDHNMCCCDQQHVLLADGVLCQVEQREHEGRGGCS